MMEQGKVRIYEPHLESLLVRNLEAERISFTTDLEAAVNFSYSIPCSTNSSGRRRFGRLANVLKVADQLGDIIEDYTVVVDKSTVPVGTADKIRK